MLVKTVLQMQINTVKKVCQKLLGELLLMFSSGKDSVTKWTWSLHTGIPGTYSDPGCMFICQLSLFYL